jgi:hypothetical protein
MAKSYQNLNTHTRTLIAGVNLTDKVGHAIKLDSSGKAALAGAGVAATYILSLPDVAGKTVSVVEAPSTVQAKSGAAFSAGDLLMADASGKLIKATATNYAIAYALETVTAADQLVGVTLTLCKI